MGPDRQVRSSPRDPKSDSICSPWTYGRPLSENPLDRDALAGMEAPRAPKAGQDMRPDTKLSAAGALLRPRVPVDGHELGAGRRWTDRPGPRTQPVNSPMWEPRLDT
jgi:hypothetical protein